MGGCWVLGDGGFVLVKFGLDGCDWFIGCICVVLFFCFVSLLIVRFVFGVVLFG